MAHAMIWYYFFCFSVGIGAIILFFISYLKYHIALLRYYIVFMVLFSVYLITNLTSVYFITILHDRDVHIYIIIFVVFFLWYSFFLYFMPAFFHFLVERNYSRKKKMIFVSLSFINLFMMIVTFLIKKVPDDIYSMLKFELQVVDSWVFIAILFYLIGFMGLNFRKIENELIRDILKKILLLTLIFVPGFILDVFNYQLQFVWKILPVGFDFTILYYFVWNSISIYWIGRFFLTKFEIAAVNRLPESFAVKFGITNREKEVIVLFVQGSSYQEICSRLFISMNTVRSHIFNVYQKTGVNNRTELKDLTHQFL